VAENDGNTRRVAIACQGAGSHTALIAGALKRLLKENSAEGHEGYEIVALSGTSDGSLCALLAWYGLLMKDTYEAVRLLDSFWKNYSVNSFQDRILNDWVLQANRSFNNIEDRKRLQNGTHG
jgi:NTE family protein